MQDLRVGRIERREEDRVEEEESRPSSRSRRTGRERHVVPERIGAAHAAGDAAERRDRPAGEDRGDNDRHDGQAEAVRGRRGRRIARPTLVPGTGSGGDRRDCRHRQRTQDTPSSVKALKVPRISACDDRERQEGRTASATSAGGPEKPGSAARRRRTAAKAKAPITISQLGRADQVLAHAEGGSGRSAPLLACRSTRVTTRSPQRLLRARLAQRRAPGSQITTERSSGLDHSQLASADLRGIRVLERRGARREAPGSPA